MTKTGNEVRSIHWAVKLLLTVLVGGLFGIGALFLPHEALETVIPLTAVQPLCVAILVLAATIFATFLYLRESHGWCRSLWTGVVVGLVASTIIMTGVFLLEVFLEWLVSMIRLG